MQRCWLSDDRKMIRIQTYRAAYQQAVADLILPIQNQEFGLAIGLAQQPDLAQIEAFYQQGCGQFWVAFDGEELVGCIALKDIANGQAALRKMFVRSSHRGREKAVAQTLLEQLFSWAQEKAVSEIFLGTTDQFVGAQKFYLKNGFEKILSDQLPTLFPRMAVDTHFYRIRLSIAV